jgi:outer membrane protein assembly factor BamE (lipoprotein component of BamABCDE complex)
MKKLSVLVVFAALLIACSHVKGTFRNVDGKAYDLEKMEQVQTGMTVDEVTSLVGTPLVITEDSEKVLHRYYMVREKIDKDKAMGVFAVEKKTTETYEVILTYENGILVHKQLTRSVDKPKEKNEEGAQ